MNTLTVDNYIVETPIKDILMDLKAESLTGKLKEIKVRGSSIQVTCPYHEDGQESHASCGIYVGSDSEKYGKFNCFTCGKKGSFTHFVALCRDCSESQAKDWLIKRYGKIVSEIKFDLEPIVLPSNTQVQKKEQEIDLTKFQSWHPYMDKRKLSKSVCENFKIKYDPKSECLVFPVWDEYGKLCMLTRRSVKNKSFYIDKDKDKPIYLMNFIRTRGISEVTVVESQINCLTLYGWNIPSVATFGCNVTNKQFEIFNRSGLTHIYLCFDGDAAGIKGTKKFIKNIRQDIFVDVIVMPKSKDVNDLTEEEFNNLEILNSQEWLKRYESKN